MRIPEQKAFVVKNRGNKIEVHGTRVAMLVVFFNFNTLHASMHTLLVVNCDTAPFKFRDDDHSLPLKVLNR